MELVVQVVAPLEVAEMSQGATHMFRKRHIMVGKKYGLKWQTFDVPNDMNFTSVVLIVLVEMT